MEYLKKYESFIEPDIDKICHNLGISYYKIDNNNYVNVPGSVDISYKGLKEIPFQFGEVGINFLCDNNQLTSLKGCPLSMGTYKNNGYFDCSHNKLTSLDNLSSTFNSNQLYISANEIYTFENIPNVKHLFCLYTPIGLVRDLIECDEFNKKLSYYIELFNDYDIVRIEDRPTISIDRLEYFIENELDGALHEMKNGVLVKSDYYQSKIEKIKTKYEII